MMNEFFYCYSLNMHTFLQSRGLRYICSGLNDKTMRKFWQYRRTGELHGLLREWAENRPA